MKPRDSNKKPDNGDIKLDDSSSPSLTKSSTENNPPANPQGNSESSASEKKPFITDNNQLIARLQEMDQEVQKLIEENAQLDPEGLISTPELTKLSEDIHQQIKNTKELEESIEKAGNIVIENEKKDEETLHNYYGSIVDQLERHKQVLLEEKQALQSALDREELARQVENEQTHAELIPNKDKEVESVTDASQDITEENEDPSQDEDNRSTLNELSQSDSDEGNETETEEHAALQNPIESNKVNIHRLKTEFNECIKSIDYLSKEARHAILTQTPHTERVHQLKAKCEDYRNQFSTYEEELSSKGSGRTKQEEQRLEIVIQQLDVLDELITQGFNSKASKDRVYYFADHAQNIKVSEIESIIVNYITKDGELPSKLASSYATLESNINPVLHLTSTTGKLSDTQARLTTLDVSKQSFPKRITTKTASFASIQQINGDKLVTTLLAKEPLPKLHKNRVLYPPCTLPHDIAIHWAGTVVMDQIMASPTPKLNFTLANDFSKFGPHYVEAAMLMAAMLRKYEGLNINIKNESGIFVPTIQENDNRVKAIYNRISKDLSVFKKYGEIMQAMRGTTAQQRDQYTQPVGPHK